MWGARSAQDELKWEEERQKRQALVRDVELKEQKERERRRQDELCRCMVSEEAHARKVGRISTVSRRRLRRDGVCSGVVACVARWRAWRVRRIAALPRARDV